MKASNYNFFFPYEADEDKMIAYNSFSNALALMDKDKYRVFREFCDKNTVITDKEFITQLKKGNFLIEDNYNELEFLRLRMLKGRYNSRNLSLTIAPTADCNFRCLYCYEKDIIKSDYMTPEVENKIIEFAEKEMKTISNFHVSWYGGEPLMNLESIERLSHRFIKLCDENNVSYEAGMISNGYLLTREICELLNNLKVAYIQITIDGPKDVHDKKRPLIDGSGTFDTIIGNLIACKDILPRISLRINTDKTNAEYIKDIIDILESHGVLGRVSPYLGMISPNNSEEEKSCFNTCDFSEIDFDFASQAILGRSLMANYPRRTASYCIADSVNGFVIAADGKLYSCYREIGDHDRCVGSLVDKIDINSNIYLEYMLSDPTTAPGCKSCNLLPVCMGGCPHMKHESGEDGCSKYKYVLDKYLGSVASRIKSSNKDDNVAINT